MRAFISGTAAFFLFVGAFGFVASPPARGADHGDAPNVDNDSGADIADIFFFLDPNDNTKAVLIGTVHGFIVPGEAGNFAAFDANVRYRIDIENTGDAKPDAFIDISFTERTSATDPQTATVRLPDGKTFTAPTTPPTLAATPNAQTITTDAASGAKFFAGEADDPFFFDIPAFQRFVASVKAGSPDPTVFQRGRDTFAGYNVLGIALSVPLDVIRGNADSNVVGVDFRTLRRSQSPDLKKGGFRGAGKFRQVDRMGNPGVNVALIPFAKKSLYNAGTPQFDAAGKFAPDIVATLTSLGTDQPHIAALAEVAVTKGDYLHLTLTTPNSGAGGGDSAGAGFPNGRRLKDDTIDTILTIVANGATLGDNVNASDVPPQDQFPFLALPQQPRDTGVVDDNTRN
jgi:hypothetical protein